MSVEVVELCAGSACSIAPYCHHYRYLEPRPGIAIKTRLPTSPGEACPDYQTKTRPRRAQNWIEAND